MTIAFDANIGNTGTGTSSTGSLNHAANAMCVVVVAYNGTTSPTVTVGGASASSIQKTSQSTNVTCEMFAVFRASAASETVSVSWGSNTRHAWSAASYTGAKSTSAWETANGASGSGASAQTASVTISAGTSGRWIVGGVAGRDSANGTGSIAIAPANSEDERDERNLAGTGGAVSISAQLQDYNTASSRSFQATLTKAGRTIQWAIVGAGLLEEPPVAPTVTTQAVTDIAETTATGNGNVTSDGNATVTARGVVVNTTGTPTLSDTVFPAASGGTGAFTADMTSLSPGTHYYVRAYATNSAGTAYGSQVEFATLGGTVVVTQTAYRVGRDDDVEGGNTWYASENTPTSVPAGQNFRVRAQVTSTGTASPALSWQARKWDSDLEEWGEWEAVRLGTAMLLTVSGDNGRYLVDGNGEPVLLVGFHTWNNVQNSGTSAPPDEFDWSEYLGALTGRGLNFTKLWTYESPRGWGRYRGIMRYERSGTSGAADGGNKFDLTALNSAWITRLRARVESCLAAGVWVCVQLFQGWDAEDKGIENSWTYHPFASANNVNSVDGDTNANGSGEETRRLASNPVLSYQETEVTAVVTALNQYPNIIWEISNEDTGHSENTAWQEYWMEFIRDLEAGMALQHLVGMIVQYPSGSNATLTSSSADWVSYSNRNSVDGAKASMSDTDHIEGLTDGHTWIWISLCNGHGGLWYMDSWDGGGYDSDTRANSTYNLIRDNLGYAGDLAGLIGSDLLLMTPQGGLSTSGYCLARNHATAGKYVAFYDGAGTFNLNLSTATGTLQVRWLRCSTGATSTSTVSGGDVRTMTPPWTGAVVLYVYHEGGG